MSSDLKITNTVGCAELEGLLDLSHIQIPATHQISSIAQINIDELFPTSNKTRARRSSQPPTSNGTQPKKLTIRLSQKTSEIKPANEPDVTGEEPSQTSKQVFNYEIKQEQFTKEELNIRPDKEIFIQFSKIKNEELIKYFIIKYKVLDYKCLAKGCPSKNGVWRRNPMYLILIRKNNNQQDLRIANLSLICPNCYCQDKGPSAFQRLKSVITRTCKLCPRVLNQSSGNYEYCYSCNEKLKHMNDDIRISDVIKYSIQQDDTNEKIKASKHQATTNIAETESVQLTRSQKARHLTNLMAEDLIDTLPGPNGKPRAKRVFAVKHFGPSTGGTNGESGFNEAELRTDLDADLLAELDAL